MHGDYFVEEQVEAWGPDTGDDGGAHDPETEYYRADTRVLAPGTTLFEFVVPMFPTRSLRQETINSYLWALKQESIPTALAISVLDVKESSDSVPSIKTHWCLVHFLLDGHHKVFAEKTSNAYSTFSPGDCSKPSLTLHVNPYVLRCLINRLSEKWI